MELLFKYLEKFTALTVREQVLASMAAAVVMYLLVDLTLVQPQAARIAFMQNQSANIKADLAKLEAAVKVASNGGDPVQKLRDELAKLEQDEAGLQEWAGLWSAQQVDVPALMAALSGVDSRVKLLQFKALPPAVIYEAVDSRQLKLKVERQGFEVELEGPYAGLLASMQFLENRLGQSFWGDLKLDAKYPVSSLRFDVRTLRLVSQEPI